MTDILTEKTVEMGAVRGCMRGLSGAWMLAWSFETATRLGAVLDLKWFLGNYNPNPHLTVRMRTMQRVLRAYR